MATSNQEFRSLPITPNHGDTDCHFLKYKADHLNFICGTNTRRKRWECPTLLKVVGRGRPQS